MHSVRPIFSCGKTVARAGRQILRLCLDNRSTQAGYKGSNPTRGTVVQLLRLAHTHQDRWRATIQIRVQRVLRSTRHHVRALLIIQSREQWPSRGSSQESQGDCTALHQTGGKHTPCNCRLAKHKPPRRMLSSTALLWAKTEARPAPLRSASRSQPPEERG